MKARLLRLLVVGFKQKLQKVRYQYNNFNEYDEIDSLIGTTDIFLKNNRVTMHSYWLDSLTDLSAYSYGANC